MNPDFSIIYEDNHIIVVNKPAGLLTQPAEAVQDSLELRVKAMLKEKYQKPGNVFLGVVHRLDKPASGIVILAKTSKALSRLNEAIKSKLFKKTYHALVEGIPHSLEGTLEHYLFHDDYQAIICSQKRANAKKAILHYKVLKKNPEKSLVEIDLETGRYHQIRAQFSEIGHPIIGDAKYGSRLYFREGTIALHHLRLQIQHPVTKEEMTFEAPESW